MVFATPNKAFTTPNSSNTRSELRHMLRGSNTNIKTHDPKNNFVIAARRDAEGFGRIGGRMDATLRVDQAKDNPDRRDIAYPVWGNTWENPTDPGAQGLPLGEDFSYTVNVYENTMYLRFENPRLGVKIFSLNLANNIDAYGNPDTKDNRYGYGGDQNYFKAGAYNQCSTKDTPGFWYAACPGTGEWTTDKANGDYAQVSFSKLTVGPATPQ